MKHVPTILAASIVLVLGAGAVGAVQAQTTPPQQNQQPPPQTTPSNGQQQVYGRLLSNQERQMPKNQRYRLVTPKKQINAAQVRNNQEYQTTGQPGQHTTKQKPASSHDVSECNKVATTVLHSLKNGNVDATTKHLDESLGHRMNSHLMLEALQHQWKSLIAKYGDAQNIGQTKNGQEIRGFTVITVPVKFQHGKIGARVRCNSGGQLASLNLGGLSRKGTPGGR